ncbi:MAG: glutamate--tRNA ligase [Candidatus Omnitrophica bacterium]|nr:glutamate--tRNA ligase [Candidatus Omnitrophota bacterium]
MIRVRFAPSPTGNLHIGGARTALFNWLYARATGGKFVLRIEDTDQVRSKEEYLDEIRNSLQWVGFTWDEIYYQSQRFDTYRQQAQRLLDEGKAYVERSPEGKEAIIYKVTPQKIRVSDLIRGEIEFDAQTIKDQVLIKSDGTPTYNFACVIDDAQMQITHVIRGDDHISNTPKQILMYQALGFTVPLFAHLPLILGAEGGRLSKRTGATAISDYRKMGYLPQALVNYLLLLSWAPGADQELIDINEAIKRFDIKDVNKTAATFDLKKLAWINNQYIKKEDPGKLSELVVPFLREKGFTSGRALDLDYVASITKLFQERLATLADFPDWADFFFSDDVKMDEAAQKKHLSADLSREFSLFIERLDTLADFDVAGIEQTFRELVKELNIEARALIHPIRVALTGKTVGPGLFDVIYYLGKERTKKRLMQWVKRSQS